MSLTAPIYRPGVAVMSRASSPPQGAPTDTTVGFIVGECSQGPVGVAVEMTSLDQLVSVFGPRLNVGYVYDSAEAFFTEGGSSLYVSRLADGASAASIEVPGLGADAMLTASGPGAYGDGMSLTISGGTTLDADSGDEGDSGSGSQGSGSQGASGAQDGSQGSPRLTWGTQAAGFTAQLFDASGAVLAQSLMLYTTDDLASWLTAGGYVTLTGYTPGQALVDASVDLEGGDDGTVPVTNPDAMDDALLAFTGELGPGQLFAPGKTDPEMQASLLAHCSQSQLNRVAFLDAPNTGDKSSLIASASALRGALEDRFGGMFAPWATVPGVAIGTTRTIPWSGIQAGMCARLDAQVGHANRAAAGDFGQSYFAIGVTQAWTDSDRQDLLYAGVNTARMRYGTVRGYGFRTLVDPNGPRNQWLQLNWARLNMQITADSYEIGEEYVFSQIDGRGLTIAAFGGELTAMLAQLYDDGALYGDTVEDSFVVNTSSTVNTIETEADGQLLAVLSVKMSPHAELVEIYIVKVALTEALA